MTDLSGLNDEVLICLTARRFDPPDRAESTSLSFDEVLDEVFVLFFPVLWGKRDDRENAAGFGAFAYRPSLIEGDWPSELGAPVDLARFNVWEASGSALRLWLMQPAQQYK